MIFYCVGECLEKGRLFYNRSGMETNSQECIFARMFVVPL
jgi:hypothetical protein